MCWYTLEPIPPLADGIYLEIELLHPILVSNFCIS